MFFLFTYGTLMKGKSNHDYLKKCRYVGDATIKGYKLYDFLLEDTITSIFPVMMKTGNENDVVHGEIYRCEDNIIRPLDRLESNGEMYNRVNDIAYVNNSTKYAVVTYVGVVDYWAGYVPRLYDITNLQSKWKYRNYVEENPEIIKEILSQLYNVEDVVFSYL